MWRFGEGSQRGGTSSGFRTAKTILVLTVLGLGGPAMGAMVASDTASDSAYNSGWANGSNGGVGFGPWQIGNTGGTGSQNGDFIGASTANGGSPGIDTGSPLRSWGMYANSGFVENAIRPFLTDGLSAALLPGETLSWAQDNGDVQSGGTDGVSLETSTGTILWELYFAGGSSDYTVHDGTVTGASETVTTTLGFTEGGVTVSFFDTGPGSYTATITRHGATTVTQVISGFLIGAPATNSIALFRAFDANGGSGSSNNDYVNSLSIVPEPATLGIISALAMPTLLCRRRSETA
jgi:hypothetical protein